MTLEEEITEAQSYLTDPPKNESNTCDRVILPILWAAGYARRDIESRVADNTGQFPDYTLLANAPSATWYLEAKAWNVALEDIHVKQALNYANHNGKRFVVLTNGQAWRLYDNSIQGLLSDKLITQSVLQDTLQVTAFLQALTKTETTSGGLERFAAEMCERKKQEAREHQQQREQAARAQREKEQQIELLALLHSTLTETLSDADNDLVLLITAYLKSKDGFQNITPKILSQWFSEIRLQPTGRNVHTTAPTTEKTHEPFVSDHSSERSFNLKAIRGIPIDGKNSKCVMLHLPDGTQIVIRSWVDFAEQAVSWLLKQSRPVPIPFESSHGTRWFLNSTAMHKRPDQRQKFRMISVNGKTVYMDKDRPGEMFLKDIYALCMTMEVAPEEFRITMR